MMRAHSILKGMVFACCLIITLGVSGCADLRRAKTDFASGEVNRARLAWEELSRRGFPEADYQLGRAIARGRIAGRPDEAISRLRLAYDLGQDKAALELGMLYGDEASPAYSIEQSIHWLRVSADLESMSAKRLIALNRLVGRGVERDREQALSELEDLAALGDVQSHYELGRIFEVPPDRSPNFDEAARWYGSAAALGHTDAQVARARLQLAGRGLPRDDRMAIQTLETAAAGGSVRAAKTLADVYADPAFSGFNPTRAEGWRAQAARMAQLDRALGDQPSSGSPATGWEDSLRLLRRQAESGHPAAANSMGDEYAGRIDRDPSARESAIRWYRVAAVGGSAPAQVALGRLLAPERSGAPASSESLRWLRRAAQAGDATALHTLGELYENGNIPGGGRVEAAGHYLAAAQAGASGSLRSALASIDRLTSEETERAYALSKSLYPR